MYLAKFGSILTDSNENDHVQVETTDQQSGAHPHGEHNETSKLDSDAPKRASIWR